MDKRRSERLRRKRQTTGNATPQSPATQPAVSQPGVSQPGAYTVYNNSYVVESEASFLPKPSPATPPPTGTTKPPKPTPSAGTPTPQSRRTRYRDSPHRYTVDDSPVPALDPEDSTQPHSTSPPPEETMPSHPQPDAQTARTNTHRVVDRVRTSLFDILGSATRRPVNPHWRPPPSLHPQNVSRPVFRTPHVSQEAPEDVLPSDDEADQPAVNMRAPPPVIRTPRWQPLAHALFRSPLKILAVLLLLSVVVLAALEARTSARANVSRACAPSINDRVLQFARLLDVGGRLGTVSEHEVVKSVLRAMTTAKSILLRNPWLMPQPRESRTSDGIVGEVITRTQLESEILPRIIRAARSAATEEAERITQRMTQDIQTQVSQTIQQQKELQDNQGRPSDPIENGLVESFVEHYAADKNQPADFALASAGGAVISTNPNQLTIWGRYLRRYARALISENAYTPTYPRSASIILSPDILPGNCWAFDGSKGDVTIRLARPIITQSITIEHTPAKSAFSTKAALHDFSVIGIPVGQQEEEFKMGDFKFDFTGDSSDGDGTGSTSHMQRFYVDATDRIVVRAVRVEILSNHGASYTAVYRIRVHGEEDAYLIPTAPGDEEFVMEE